jgi:hypothetical protein
MNMGDLAFKKPGKKIRTEKIKNTKTRIHDIDKPRDTYCRFCGEDDDGTAYYHHTEDRHLKLKYGKGTGTKVDDRLSVWAHHKCGIQMSEKPLLDEEYEQWRMVWYLGIIETWLV